MGSWGRRRVQEALIPWGAEGGDVSRRPSYPGPSPFLRPVPELPGKVPFHVGNDDFIEKRRQGLQQFLEQAVQSMVLLSDSQLHLFLQSQLSLRDIEACVQGHRSFTATAAILSYAMSNRGWVQEETL
ncbi:hypothetical protein FKM82_021809 [Ascaphus truei]